MRKLSLPIKIIIAVMAVIIFSLSAFFITWGVSRSQLKKLSAMEISGTYTEYNWKKTDTFKVEDYKKYYLNENGNFDVLFLTDIHYNNDGWYGNYYWSGNSKNRKTDRDIRQLVKESNPQLIIVTGDLETGSLNDINYDNFASFMEEFKTPWTVTFGNHDAEHRADKLALMNIMQKYEYCIFQQGPTNLQGLGNTIINIFNNIEDIVFSFILLDTGDWQNSEDNQKAKNRGEHQFSTVDVGITDSQIDWYNWVLDGLENHNKGTIPQTLVATHIPLQAYAYAVANGTYTYGSAPYSIDEFLSYETSFDKLFKTDETVNRHSNDAYNEYKSNDKFFNAVKTRNSTKTFITGHNHCAGYSVVYDEINYVSVIKTGDIYVDTLWDGGNRGGTKMTIDKSGKVSTKLLHTRVGN